MCIRDSRTAYRRRERGCDVVSHGRGRRAGCDSLRRCGADPVSYTHLDVYKRQLFDLATPLFFFQGHPDYADFRASLLAGYRAERPLSEAEHRLLDLFLVARGYTYLGWAATRPETDTAAFLISEIVPLVVRLAAELERELS